MPATPITNPVSGESLVGTEPQLLQQIDPGWRRRLNLFTGRALTDTALDNEQLYRGGLLATLGQSVTAGTVNGLALTIDTSGPDPLLLVSPGYGIAGNGEDVVLNRPLKTKLSTLAVIDAVAESGENVLSDQSLETLDAVTDDELSFHQFATNPTNTTYAGILLLQPVVAQVSGQSLDTSTGPIEVAGNLAASCDQDPEEYAFEDWQIADAVRLVFLPWPTGTTALPLPPLDPVTTWRNRLAYTIFEAEALLGPDDQLPWAMLGVPVALIAFDPGVTWTANTAFSVGQFITDPNGNVQRVQTAGKSGNAQPAAWNPTYGLTTPDNSITWVNNGFAWKPLFVDCSVVVRAGGLPRRRYVLPSQPPPLRQWQSSTAFKVGDFILDPHNDVQIVHTAGTTGGPPVQWNVTTGQNTPDGTVIWTNNGPGSWQPNTSFAAGQFFYDSNGNIQTVLTAGISGKMEPDWNGIYLPTTDGTVQWINNGSGNPPIIQPALAQARINQLSEQLSQTMSQPPKFITLADIFTTLPPSGILPAAALDFLNKTAPWFPRNWSISAAPVYLEELETVLETGMTEALITAQASAPADPTLFEPVEVLIPLPDSVYDPNILVTEAVAPVFQQEVTLATQQRNLTLQRLKIVQLELNTLFAAIGPNVPANPNLIVPDAGLTQDEITGRNTPPPYTPSTSETFGTLLQTTWLPLTAYTAGEFVIDGNGSIQVVQTAGTSAAANPAWNTNIGQITADGIRWVNSGNARWQSGRILLGQLILDSNNNIQLALTAGSTGVAAPTTWNQQPGQITNDGGVAWNNLGHAAWQASNGYASGQAILDPAGNIQFAQVGGKSGANQPTWTETRNATTLDAHVAWLNNGPWAWQPQTIYIPGQFVVDASGFIQVVTTGGVSASSPPSWSETPNQSSPPSWSEVRGLITRDGIIWQAGGNAAWQPDNLYTAGQLILDANHNIQIVQTGGISGDSPPAVWNPTPGQTTQDSAVIWNNLGHSLWQPNTAFTVGQAIIDSNGNIQLVQVGGTSGSSPPAPWREGVNATTTDASVTWTNNGALTWQAGNYTKGQVVIDSNGNLQVAQTTGVSGNAPPSWNTTPGQTTGPDGAILWLYPPFNSTDLLQIQTVVSQPPYSTTFQDSAGISHSLNLLSADDLANLTTNGLQSLITSLNARISQANDLLDTGFLTAQTDIYRYRQNVLGSTAASTLATSPVLANIATGETATATAVNLQDYIATLQTPATSTTSGSTAGTSSTAPPVSSGPVLKPILNPIKFPVLGFKSAVTRAPAARTMAVTRAVNLQGSVASTSAERITGINIGVPRIITPTTTTIPISQISPTQILVPGQNGAALPSDITGQSPIAGAELNVRTLTIAERLQQSPSQEAMFYSIANRLSFLQMLEILENDLNLVADDLQILVDDLPTAPPPSTTPAASTTPNPVPVVAHTFSEWLDPNNQSTLLAKIQSPYIVEDASEATLFSVGIRVTEQHTMLMRALEARVQQYVDFVGLCTTALNNIQSNSQQAQVYITQQQNNLLQSRQNVSFTTALLSDEILRVNGVNAQRLQILQSSVQLVAYTRARTLNPIDTSPSRQLVPSNIASPVPACLQQSVSIPPELREIVNLLREAPLNWLPSAAWQVSYLERPVLLQQLALSTQARAAQQLQTALLPSSASGEPGVYAPSISSVYSANQTNFRNLQVQRAALQPASLTNLSWSLQVATVQSVAAVNDLISSDSVHTEVTNAVSRQIQDICSVATCLYTRVSIALPVNRLAWAEYLRGAGLSSQLQSLAILPNWNQLPYVDRQQMQLLVDWLFQQIDTGVSAAIAFMSDVVRTAILLASDVPVDNIIPANIILRTLPTIGGVVSLNLPSDRVSAGMYVNLYSGATLAARATVSDLDTHTVSATVTDVFAPGVYLETSDIAHFTAQTPQAIALRPLFMQN
jgi:hypothetical protein